MQTTLAHYSESDIQKSLAAHFREKELAGGFTFFAIPGGSVRVPPHIGKQMKDARRAEPGFLTSCFCSKAPRRC
jgi:hypothetical protein